MSAEFKAPVQRTLCWHCDRRLYAGGRSYRMVMIDGRPRPVHVACAAGYALAVESADA